MLSKRAYQALVITCPALALAAGVVLSSRYPELAWYTGAGIVATLSLILVLVRPGSTRERLRHLNLALSSTPSATLILDLDGMVLCGNEAAAALLEADREDLEGAAFADLVEGEAWSAIQAERRSLISGEALEVEGRLAASRGAWTRGVVSLTRDERDRPELIMVQLLDLSAPGPTLATVGSESRLQQTLDLTSDLILTLDAKGRITRTNRRGNEVLLGGDSSLRGTSIVEFVHPTDRAALVTAFNHSRSNPDRSETLEQIKVMPGGRRSPAGRQRFVTARLITLAGSATSTLLICQDTTQESTSQDLLRSSEDRFSRIFHSSPDAILIVRHADSVILDFNPGFTRLLGYSREEAIGQPESSLALFLDPDDRALMISEVTRTGECTGVETQLRSKSGEVLTVETSMRYVEIDGELCTMCISRDITKRTRAERALIESEEKFERVFNETPDGIVILRLEDQVICDVNQSFVVASEYAREALIGRTVEELNAIEDHEAYRHTISELLDVGRCANRELSMRSRSGRVVQTLTSATVIDLQGIPCALCIVKDISSLRDAEQRLQSSELRFRGAFENAPIGILLVDMEGRIFEANRFAAELLAYDGEDSLVQVHISRLIPAEDRSEFKETLQRLVSGAEDTVRAERRMLCRDGLQIWTNFHMGLQRDADEGPGYCIVQLADITEMKNSQHRIERKAFYDTLTDLANRRLFFDRLGGAIAHARRSRSLAALLYLDLDQFKRVNDTLGHEMGDVLLQEVATRLCQCVRQGDTVGRPGGDEFTMLLTDIKTPTDAGLVADKVLDALRSPISLSGHQVVITTSIGITIIPDDGTEPNALLKNADLAMYRAKDNGRNNYQFYSEEMNTNAVRRLRTEYELRRAMERAEFELYYQPKVRLADQRITGVECLIRWCHPERGVLPPAEFIDVAEETGVIVDIGTWVIAEGCRAGRTLAEQTGREVQIAINISPRQFKDPNLVSTIRRSLRESGLSPGALELEITETMLMGDIEAAKQTVTLLHELGVKLAIDDFGTGYSSLNYLKKFPIDTVKVDRSFITDIPSSDDDCAITSAVIAMAHRLNMEVVAEGVESHDQLTFLKDNSCEYAQGYLFSKPVALANISAMLAPKVRLLRST